jgi:hypothetical protein
VLLRTRGWWTVEPFDVLNIVEEHGKLLVGEKGELMVEFTDPKTLDALSTSLRERFGDQVLLAP